MKPNRPIKTLIEKAIEVCKPMPDDALGLAPMPGHAPVHTLEIGAVSRIKRSGYQPTKSVNLMLGLMPTSATSHSCHSGFIWTSFIEVVNLADVIP